MGGILVQSQDDCEATIGDSKPLRAGASLKIAFDVWSNVEHLIQLNVYLLGAIRSLRLPARRVSTFSRSPAAPSRVIEDSKMRENHWKCVLKCYRRSHAADHERILKIEPSYFLLMLE